MAHQRRFSAELKILTAAKVEENDVMKCDVPFPKSSKLNRLDPFLNNDDIICVAGRLKRSFLNKKLKFPIILLKEERIAALIIQDCNSRCTHGGRATTLNELCSTGYWITNGNSAVRSVTLKCVLCCRLRGRLGVQKMAERPVHRRSYSLPFIYCGVDMFGTFLIKQRRNKFKRYDAMFTCMGGWVVHIDITHSLDADSFIPALRRVIARRGNNKTLFSDNGSNFVDCENELKKSYEETKNQEIQSFMQVQGGEWIEWARNSPAISHIRGVWERKIRSSRAILLSLLKTHGKSLDEESLLTLVTDAEGILNPGPPTTETICDPTSDLPLSPSNILTMKSKVVMPSPGNFS